jgi:HAD superfamily hydrolase (TIGR01484 family)
VVKILFIDIDGTLVRGLGKISRKNLLAIKKYVELGGKVVLSTGRSIVSIRKCVEQIKKKTNYVPEYAICSTGGYIYNYLDQTAYINPINNELARKIYEYCKKNHLIMWSYTENSNQKNAVYSNYPLY